MTLPPRLESELDELTRASYNIEVVEEPDFINLVFKGFPLGPGFNMAQSDLLLMIPRAYPDAGPDMFWVDPGVMLASGQIPQSAETVEQRLNRPWRRFSWHRQGSPWNPTIDNLRGHIEFVQRRLKESR